MIYCKTGNFRERLIFSEFCERCENAKINIREYICLSL